MIEVAEALRLQHHNIERRLEDFEEVLNTITGDGELAEGVEGQENARVQAEINSFFKIIEEDILRHFQIEEEGVVYALSMLTDIEGPSIDFIEEEHGELKQLFENMKSFFQEENFRQLYRTGQEMSDLLLSHMGREEESVYYMMNHFLTEEQLRLIEEKFNQLESGIS